MQFAVRSDRQRIERAAGKAGQAQNWGPVREQERRPFLSLLQEPG